MNFYTIITSFLLGVSLSCLSANSTAQGKLPEELLTFFAASEMTGKTEEVVYQFILSCDTGEFLNSHPPVCELILLVFETCEKSHGLNTLSVYPYFYSTDRNTLDISLTGPSEIKVEFGEEGILDRKFKFVLKFKEAINKGVYEPRALSFEESKGFVTRQTIKSPLPTVLKKETMTSRLRLLQKNSSILKRKCPVELMVIEK